MIEPKLIRTVCCTFLWWLVFCGFVWHLCLYRQMACGDLNAWKYDAMRWVTVGSTSVRVRCAYLCYVGNATLSSVFDALLYSQQIKLPSAVVFFFVLHTRFVETIALFTLSMTIFICVSKSVLLYTALCWI